LHVARIVDGASITKLTDGTAGFDVLPTDVTASTPHVVRGANDAPFLFWSENDGGVYQIYTSIFNSTSDRWENPVTHGAGSLNLTDYLGEHGSVTRERLFERFRNDPEQSLAAVLSDLSSEGLVYVTGRGQNTVYGLSSEADRTRVAETGRKESVRGIVWQALYRAPATVPGIQMSIPAGELEADADITYKGVVIIDHDGGVIYGHHTVAAAIESGITEIPVLELPEDEVLTDEEVVRLWPVGRRTDLSEPQES
jgi:hypothetical protein